MEDKMVEVISLINEDVLRGIKDKKREGRNTAKEGSDRNTLVCIALLIAAMGFYSLGTGHPIFGVIMLVVALVVVANLLALLKKRAAAVTQEKKPTIPVELEEMPASPTLVYTPEEVAQKREAQKPRKKKYVRSMLTGEKKEAKDPNQWYKVRFYPDCLKLITMEEDSLPGEESAGAVVIEYYYFERLFETNDAIVLATGNNESVIVSKTENEPALLQEMWDMVLTYCPHLIYGTKKKPA